MEQKPPKERKKIIRKLKIKYRLVIQDENNFAEKFSLRLSAWNLFIGFGTLSLLLIFLTTIVIAFTPLREYIPGYPDGSERATMLENVSKADSLERELEKYDQYIADLKVILSGESIPDTLATAEVKKPKDVQFSKSLADSALRYKVEQSEKYQLQFANTSNVVTSDNMYGVFFFTPLEGTVMQSFDPKSNHFGIDISSGNDEMVKSTLDGTVIFADWTSDGGQEIHIQHSGNIVSIYKHNSVLLKTVGNVVKAGDPLAIVGNTGKQSQGPHLHFELWHKGKPVDPQNYLIL